MRYYKASAYNQALLTHVLREDQTFSVHSLFQSGMNLLIGERLLYVGSRTAMVPFAVMMQEPQLIDLISLCRPGDEGIYRRDSKQLLWESGTVLDLSGAEQWDGKVIGQLSGENWARDSREHLRLCWEKQSPAYGLTQEFPQAEDLVRAFKDIICEDSAAMCRRLDFWIGRGLGLTPSGDDMLVGLLAVLYWAKCSAPFDVILDYLREKGRERTTPVSHEYLYYAAQGIFSESILRLLKAMPEAESCNSAFSGLLTLGHTSGADTILGMLGGLELLLEERYGHKETFCNRIGR